MPTHASIEAVEKGRYKQSNDSESFIIHGSRAADPRLVSTAVPVCDTATLSRYSAVLMDSKIGKGHTVHDVVSGSRALPPTTTTEESPLTETFSHPAVVGRRGAASRAARLRTKNPVFSILSFASGPGTGPRPCP